MAGKFTGPGSFAAALGAKSPQPVSVAAALRQQAGLIAPHPPGVLGALADTSEAPPSVHDQLADQAARLDALEDMHGPYRQSHPAGHFTHPDNPEG